MATRVHPWAEFFKGKNKMAADISRSNIIFQQMKPGTSVISYVHVILTG